MDKYLEIHEEASAMNISTILKSTVYHVKMKAIEISNDTNTDVNKVLRDWNKRLEEG